jgi:hypothetical protein
MPLVGTQPPERQHQRPQLLSHLLCTAIRLLMYFDYYFLFLFIHLFIFEKEVYFILFYLFIYCQEVFPDVPGWAGRKEKPSRCHAGLVQEEAQRRKPAAVVREATCRVSTRALLLIVRE